MKIIYFTLFLNLPHLPIFNSISFNISTIVFVDKGLYHEEEKKWTM